MEMTGNVLVPVLFCVGLAVLPGVQSLDCTGNHAYMYLHDFLSHDRCVSVDLVFKYLNDMTDQTGNGNCRRDIIDKLANHFGAQAHTPGHCQCSGAVILQDYGNGKDVRNTCLTHHGYADLYNQFFHSQHQPSNLVCRTHHSLWTLIHQIDDHTCQHDIVQHISTAFSQHKDPCTCSEKPVTATSSPSQHQGQHDCHQYTSYKELDNLVHHSECISSNTVFEYLHDMTEQNSDGTCRREIIKIFADRFGAQAHTPDHCQCPGTFKHLNYSRSPTDGIIGDYAEECSRDYSAYKDIYNNFFASQLQDLVCQTHHSLWTHLRDIGDARCQKDLVYHISYAFSQHGDPCLCSEKTTLSMTRTATTTSTTILQTTTPTTSTKKSDFTTTSLDAVITHVNCSLYNQYSTCEDQTLCIYFSDKPWIICDNAAYAAKCPRLCSCCNSMATSAHAVAPSSGSTTVMTLTTLETSTLDAYTTEIHKTSTNQAGQWSEWYNAKCSATCDIGTQHRVRFCSTGQNADCTGSPTDRIPCNEQNCTQPDQLLECNHTCTLFAAGIGKAVVSPNAAGCTRPSEFASDEALLITCCPLGLRHGWRKGRPVQPTGVCITGEIPYYTPVSLYNGPAFTDNQAGIYVGCIADGQSGFKMIAQNCNTLPTVIFVNGIDVIDPNNYFVIF